MSYLAQLSLLCQDAASCLLFLKRSLKKRGVCIISGALKCCFILPVPGALLVAFLLSCCITASKGVRAFRRRRNGSVPGSALALTSFACWCVLDQNLRGVMSVYKGMGLWTLLIHQIAWTHPQNIYSQGWIFLLQLGGNNGKHIFLRYGPFGLRLLPKSLAFLAACERCNKISQFLTFLEAEHPY